MRYLKPALFSFLLIGITMLSFAYNGPIKTVPGAEGANIAQQRGDCAPATAQIDLDINNIRARIRVGGDVWLPNQYIIPKPPAGSNIQPTSSLYGGAVWIGGLDPGGSLKLAAQTYGTGGITDFWPGPLTEFGTVGEDTCSRWDKLFRVSGFNIDQHIIAWKKALEAGEDELEEELIPEDIKGWPADKNPFFFEINKFDLPFTDQGLAPFWDENGNGAYEPHLGDHPIIDIRGCEEDAEGNALTPQFGDEMIFWIYNDAGGIHSESGGDAIQMEIQVEAFGYATNDEINDMTFYRYKLINRAIESIDSCYFAMWVDPDLGCYSDDYVGCDTSRSLMYVYNSDALDGEANCNDCNGWSTYCTEIPILGVDYFRGPLGPKLFCNGVDASDGLCNPPFGIAQVDTIVELGMSSFTYYNYGWSNPSPPPGTDGPSSAPEYYNYLSGSWRDGLRFTYGGDGHNLGNTNYINYAFTEAPDDVNGWSMQQEGLANGDRVTIQASGPFRLDPGAINELIIGVVWIPDVDYPAPSIRKLTSADDIAQALFDNCFDLTDGPDAPDACFIELDQEIILTLSNEETSNNFEEAYLARDLRASPLLDDTTASYKFEGYKILQLTNANVSPAEFDDPGKARVIYQVDIKNGVKEIFNWTSIDNPLPGGEDIWVPESKVEGADEGVRHTFRIAEDQFALSDKRLVNHKKYYFTVIAYAYNNFETFDPDPPISGQRTPYLEGRRNIGPEPGISGFTVIPRPIVDRGMLAEYGDGPVITRLDGIGAGGIFLEVSDETREAMFNGSLDGEITYLQNSGPLDIKVYNPLDVVDGTFELTFEDENNNNKLDNEVRWRLKNVDDPSFEVLSATTIDQLNEQTISDYGFSLSIVQTDEPGSQIDVNNGAIGFDISYEDLSKPIWLSAFPSGIGPLNWLGTATASRDPNLGLANMTGGFLYPYNLIDYGTGIVTPAWANSSNNIVIATNTLNLLNNVDIVLTSDKSKWSRCVVVESANAAYTDTNNNGLGLPTEGGVKQFSLRAGATVGSDTDPNGEGSGTGMSWFPGYAVDVETGKRLNIFFGENSTYDCAAFSDPCDDGSYEDGGPTGRDMIFNPTTQIFLPGVGQTIYSWLAGGQHFVYVTSQEYDKCAQIAANLQGNSFQKTLGIGTIKWAGLLVPAFGEEMLSYNDGLIPNDVTMKVRVDNKYKEAIGTGENNGLNKYLFSFDGAQADEIDTDAEVKTQLDAINVVPNPYYGFSAYETSQFTNTVKITNLPAKCTVTIFTLDGKFIRQYKRNEERMVKDALYAPLLSNQISPAIEWDLENEKGIPVASGVYLIHVDADGLGERVIKWFGVARQFDPSGL